MNLAPQIGKRSVFTWQETMTFLGFNRNQVRYLVDSGKLKKAYSGKWPFTQKDVNEFLVRLNSGKVS